MVLNLSILWRVFLMFRIILNFIFKDLLDEAEMFKLSKLCELCQQKIHERNIMQQRVFLN
jgi:hypothetical protein